MLSDSLHFLDDQFFSSVLHDGIKDFVQVCIAFVRMGNLVDAELTAQLYLSIACGCQDTSLKTLVLRDDGRIALFSVKHIALWQRDIHNNTVCTRTLELYRNLTACGTEGILSDNRWERTYLDGIAIHLSLAGKRSLLSFNGGKGCDAFLITIVHSSQSLIACCLRTCQGTINSKLGIDNSILL